MSNPVIISSDIRNVENLKEFKKPILKRMNAIKFSEFDWSREFEPKDNKRHVDFGILAQHLDELGLNLTTTHMDNTKFLNISNICIFALKAIQELTAKVEILESYFDIDPDSCSQCPTIIHTLGEPEPQPEPEPEEEEEPEEEVEEEEDEGSVIEVPIVVEPVPPKKPLAILKPKLKTKK